MSEKENIQKELEELAPELSQVKKENLFEVPADYFQKLPGELMAKLQSEPQANWWDTLDNQIQLWLDKWLKPQFAMPAFASMVVLIMAAHLLIVPPGSVTEPTTLAGISDAVLEDYVYDYSDEFDLAVMSYPDDATILDEEEKISEEILEDYIFDNIDELTIWEALL